MEFQSFAKINLYLDVLDRREDGYTNIETIFQTVSLHDRLRVEPADRDIVLQCSMPGLETDDSNLVCRAARALQQAARCDRGAIMHLDKHIPVAAGLAGGSGNAAAALTALNAMWDLNLPAVKLKRIALSLGSDVPYCLIGGTASATGRGEVLKARPAIPATWFALVHPPFPLSTAAVYNSPNLERNTARPGRGGTKPFAYALRALKAGRIADVIFNRMETAAFPMHPELANIKQQLLDLGCTAAAMSGSGPTVFGVCTSESHARSIAEAGLPYPVSVVRSVETGVAPLAS